MGLRVLFSEAMGFECIEAGMSNPIVGRFSSLADKYLRYKWVPALYCHSEFLGKKVRDVESFDWNKIDVAELVEIQNIQNRKKLNEQHTWKLITILPVIFKLS